MGRVTLDAELKARLNGLDEQLEICDESGRVVGRFLPEAAYARLLYAAVEAACPHNEDELERRRKTETGRSLKDFWKDLGGQ